MIVSCGLIDRLNTVPLPERPPYCAVPYSVLPDNIKPANGLAPSLLVKLGSEIPVKLCRFTKPVPSVLTANTVPQPELPPPVVVPNSVLPDKINPATGRCPSLPPAKLWTFVKPAPLVLTANTVPQLALPLPPYNAVP